ncbi:hypothetical protein BGX33_005335 [Mortierella sp. NVP41]|nr:hypothetical protein BGX33_005335 [Mortierella sp. NVP41]
MSSGQQSPLSAGSESPGTPPSNRKRDKARAFFGLSPSKSKVKPKASNQSPGSQLTTNVSRSPSTAFRVRNVPSDIQQSMSSSVIKPVSQTISFTADQPVTEIFSENMPEPIIKTALPALQDRIEQTQQLVYCNRLLLRGISSPSAKVSAENSAMESGDGLHDAAVQEPKFDETERAWLRAVQHHPDQQHHLRWLINNLVQEFAKDDLKGPAAIAEAVILGPVLDRDTYRSLLSCFITKFEQTTILDITLLQGLVQLIESASSGYLEDDDLVRTLGVLRQRLKGTHKQSSEQVYQTTLAISRLLDVMVNGMVKDLNRTDDHQPLVEVLNKLKDATDPILQFQVVYALQALQYIPDDESTLQAVLRFAGGVTMAALGVASICKLDPTNLFNSLDTLRQAAGQSYEVTKSILEGMEASQRGRFGAMQSLLKGFRAGTKHEWFLMLLAARTFVRNGRLADFNRTVCEAPCRDERAFQLGVCQILGEITMEPLWDIRSRQLAADFLGALHRNNSGWKQHSDVKHWIITILTQISGVSDSAVSDNALAVLQSLEQDDDTSNMSPLPLWSRLPLPEFCPLLTRVQHIPYVEYNLHQLNLRRIEEGHLPVYIPPMAKANLQARDDVLFPLMEKVQDFLGSSREVMLILGDSGAGKSTFNKHLESELLRSYTTGGPIPLFINLPALDRPDKELMAEQLQAHNFSDAQIQELKQHRQFVVICDGYDESQLKSNLHTTNLLNRSGQWKVKLIITCRTQYLGQDYRDLFVPQGSQGGGHYNHPAIDLFQEAVIAPFSTDQIELYVERYVPLEPRTWVKEDYMDKLNTIPNLMDLVKNPFLLTLTLGALPTVIQGKQDLSRFHITRVELYDNFVEHWLGANKRRLRNLKLSGDGLKVFEELLDDGFEQSGFNFQKDLAVAIFIQQEGRPVVDYTHNRDRTSWKGAFFSQEPGASLLRAASLLTRVGNQYRFIHRSVLEYFYSCIVCQSAFNNAELAPPVQFNPLITLSPIAEHPLSQSSLVPEPSVVQFLTERVNASPPFRQHLFDLIELSKTDPQASQAAANAMTVLVKTGVRFHGADLRGIRVPGADLSGGEFDSAQMEGADLRGVNLTRSWIRKVDFSNSQMDGVVFGELPYLEQSSSQAIVLAICYRGSFEGNRHSV